MRFSWLLLVLVFFVLDLLLFPGLRLNAQEAHFHNAPASATQQKNPVAGQHAAVQAGAKLYAADCAGCHGPNGQGIGTFPALAKGPSQTAPDGELFWFITTGAPDKGMPPWGSLSEQQRWQLVTFLKSLKTSASSSNAGSRAAGFVPAALQSRDER
jgi:mono/diheme cytochrome c family protein